MVPSVTQVSMLHVQVCLQGIYSSDSGIHICNHVSWTPHNNWNSLLPDLPTTCQLGWTQLVLNSRSDNLRSYHRSAVRQPALCAFLGRAPTNCRHSCLSLGTWVQSQFTLLITKYERIVQFGITFFILFYVTRATSKINIDTKFRESQCQRN